MSIIKKSIIFLAATFILAGCSLFGQSPAEEAHIVLESTVKLENNLSKQEVSLGDLESKEQIVYNKISELSSEETASIQELATEAIEIAEERKEKIKEEREYILSAKKEFEKLESLMGELEKEEVKKALASLQETMDARYSIYEEIYNTYVEGIKQDKALYQLLQAEDVTLESFEEQLKKNNKTYEKVEELNTTFNEKTEEFNERKQTFHDAAGLKPENK